MSFAASRNGKPDPAYLLSAAAVRERCGLVLAAALRGETRHFRLAPARLEAVAERVAALTRRRFPDLDVPYHSRWRHFAVGGYDRAALVAPGRSPRDQARARIDLAVVSVLLDAGAGPQWQYREAETGQVLSRSEGLAVASLRAMQTGRFSADAADPWRADAAALRQISSADLAAVFQHRPGNELAGIEGRAALLRRLGEVAAARPNLFGSPARLGNLIDALPTEQPLSADREQERAVPAPDILRLLLHALGPIWPGRLSAGNVPLGDCWPHPAIPGDGLVPFHKLSQWLAYSLIEPLVEAGTAVTDIDGLTGLAEYRNGGLLLDGGVLEACDPALLTTPLEATAEAVVEWRALTVALLDRLAPLVRQRLGKTSAELPLAKVLEGGTWLAGREIAAEQRSDARPPLTIISDGTVF